MILAALAAACGGAAEARRAEPGTSAARAPAEDTSYRTAPG
jgi:hypothetical protein